MAGNPGYHIAKSGKVFSDHCSLTELRRVRRQIHLQFYTPMHILRVARKGLRAGAASFLPALLPYLPRILGNMLAYFWRRSRRRARKRRDQQAAPALSAEN